MIDWHAFFWIATGACLAFLFPSVRRRHCEHEWQVVRKLVCKPTKLARANDSSTLLELAFGSVTLLEKCVKCRKERETKRYGQELDHD
jgi:hypothetical protein